MATRSEILALVEGCKTDEKKYEKLAEFQWRRTEGVTTLEDDNDGDGREMYLTLEFSFEDGEPNLLVSLRGTYSSHGDSYWNEVFLSEPYTYTVTSYRRIGETA